MSMDTTTIASGRKWSETVAKSFSLGLCFGFTVSFLMTWW